CPCVTWLNEQPENLRSAYLTWWNGCPSFNCWCSGMRGVYSSCDRRSWLSQTERGPMVPRCVRRLVFYHELTALPSPLRRHTLRCSPDLLFHKLQPGVDRFIRHLFSKRAMQRAPEYFLHHSDWI